MPDNVALDLVLHVSPCATGGRATLIAHQGRLHGIVLSDHAEEAFGDLVRSHEKVDCPIIAFKDSPTTEEVAHDEADHTQAVDQRIDL